MHAMSNDWEAGVLKRMNMIFLKNVMDPEIQGCSIENTENRETAECLESTSRRCKRNRLIEHEAVNSVLVIERLHWSSPRAFEQH